MKQIVSLILFLSLSNFGFSQNTTLVENQMSVQEIDSIFTLTIKSKFDITYPIYRAYKYKDEAGSHIILMTERVYLKAGEPVAVDDTKIDLDSIKAFHFLVQGDSLSLTWTLKDFIIKNDNDEHSIYFWTKYFKIEDYDGDGLMDPIMVYGSLGMNGHGDGRIKILVYHKGKKRAIRHQNGVLDYERNTKVDAQFYNLPKTIQERVIVIMEGITKNRHGIFPNGWQDAMKNKELKFDEN